MYLRPVGVVGSGAAAITRHAPVHEGVGSAPVCAKLGTTYICFPPAMDTQETRERA
jgi:hypothetical protein